MKHLLPTIATISLIPSLHCTAEENKTVSLFDGKTLTGWNPVNTKNLKYWSIIDGVITASNGSNKMPTNTYLSTDKSYQNFEFNCKFRLSGDHKTGLINSGIQYRSLLKRIPNKPGVNHIIGYQADIGKGYWGDIYDEHRRGKLTKGNTNQLLKNFKEDDWNDYTIRCRGNHHELIINGHKTADYTETDSAIEDYGVIALQLHSGGIAKMEYKDISITEFPATKMELPIELAANQTKIHGKGMRLNKNMIVSWNQTNDYLEWTIPPHFKPGKYNITLNYSCDTNRQGSSMSFSSVDKSFAFKTKGKAAKWSPGLHPVGSYNLKPGDILTLKCDELKADWVLDFHRIIFEAIE